MSVNRDWDALARKRMVSVLTKHGIATMRTLEQKISDAGPYPQRTNPHVLTEARAALVKQGIVVEHATSEVTWLHLATTAPEIVASRLSEQMDIYEKVHNKTFNGLVGQALEIAIYRALLQQSTLTHMGNFMDLDEHDDSELYSKEEPPSSISGNHLPNSKKKKKLDFIIIGNQGERAGIEAKNHREWVYPNHKEVHEMLLKCVALDLVPVLIARRIHYLTFELIHGLGGIIHETYNQLYPQSYADLAALAKDKRLLGYHDIRVGNEPDDRLIKFIHTDLPNALPEARRQFDLVKPLAADYVYGRINFNRLIRHLWGSKAAAKARSIGIRSLDPEDVDQEPNDIPF
jgi:hypothetical protein